MNPIANNILLFSMVLYSIFLVIEFYNSKKKQTIFIQIVIISVVTVVLFFMTGFPFPKVSFGTTTSIMTVSIMFGCVIFGIFSNYLFFSTTFTWREFLRPVLISPIVLMPLYGLVEGTPDIQNMKLISLCLISFQNGFFWKVLFEKISKSTTGEPQ